MRKLKLIGLLIFLLALVVSTPASAAAPTPAEVKQEKDEIRKKTKEILAQLYKAEPSAKATISKAAGYAVFSNFGMKIFVAGSGTGKGIAVSNKTKKEVFMRRILVTNDDGYRSEGIVALADALRPLGEVIVVAPVLEASAIGHALTLRRPLRLETVAANMKDSVIVRTGSR